MGGGGSLRLIRKGQSYPKGSFCWLIVDGDLPEYPLAEFDAEDEARRLFEQFRDQGRVPLYSRPALGSFLWEGPMPGELDEPPLEEEEFVNQLHLHLWWLSSGSTVGKRAWFSRQRLGDGALLRNAIGIDLSKANLRGLRLRGADLKDVELKEADLSFASFVDCDLRGVDLSGAKLTDADLSGSNLRGAKGVMFDGTRIHQAQFLPGSPYVWFNLRRQYTGPRMLFHLGLLAVALLPIALKALYWLGVNQAQESLADWVPMVQANLAGQDAVGGLSTIGPCLTFECQEWRIWQLVFGVDRPWPQMILAGVLTVYNGLRVYLTWKIGPLRDEEDLLGVTPRRAEYWCLHHVHLAIRLLLFVAFAVLLWHAVDWLFLRKVWLPLA